MGSIIGSVAYKNFSLGFLLDHRQGGTFLSYENSVLFGDGMTTQTLFGREGGLIFGDNIFSNIDAVQANGDPNTIATDAESFWVTVGRSNLVGEAFKESATNTRLRELSIGYSLPAQVLKFLRVSNVKFSLVGRNLFFISRASKMLDPDIMEGTGPGVLGYVPFIRPTSRTFGATVKVTF